MSGTVRSASGLSGYACPVECEFEPELELELAFARADCNPVHLGRPDNVPRDSIQRMVPRK
jgi:hypothetical protein